jgi:hypothetical protein
MTRSQPFPRIRVSGHAGAVQRAAHDGHEAALRNLANKLIGQLDYCLRNQVPYREDLAWPPDDCMDASAAA